MAASRFYEGPSDMHLKPMHLSHIQNHSSTSLTSTFTQNDTYHQLPNFEQTERDLHALSTRDTKLKKFIRVLRVISRIIATIVSAVTLIPLIMTIVKFVETRNTYRDVNGVVRTAWAHDTITWYTYMYTAISAISLILNLIILISYCKGIRAANKASTISTTWTWVVTLSHVVVWAVAAGVYRYGKEPDKNGKHRDLWGWTCSDAAKEIQEVFEQEVDFGRYCNVQSSSFYTGVANVVAGVLTLIITIMALVRMRTKKKKAKRVATMKTGGDMEPLRS